MRTRILLATGAVVAAVLPVLGLSAPAHAAIDPVLSPTISVSPTHSLTIDANGLVFGAGDNSHSQLGGAGGHPSLDFVPLPGSVKATAVSAGSYYSLALGANGVPYGLGRNDHGQVAGASIEPSGFAPMSGLPIGVTATAVSASRENSLVLGSDGVVYGTGANVDDQLTGAAGVDKTTLTPLTGLPPGVKATAIDSGGFHSLVIGDNNVVYGAGRNDVGQLGGVPGADVATLNAIAPLPGGATPTAIAAGDDFSLILGSDGLAYGIGGNLFGQLTGVGNRTVPALLAGLPGGVTATGVGAGASHSVIFGSDGHLYGSGANSVGQLTGTDSVSVLTPLQSIAGTDLMGFAVGAFNVLQIDSDHTVYGVGLNESGQLTTNGGPTKATVFVQLAGQRLASVNAPVISGTAKVGSTLSATTGDWSPAATGFGYQWTRDNAPIAGANARAYKATAADKGKTLRVEVTAGRAAFSSNTVTRSAGVVALGSKPVYAGSPKPAVAGIAKVGKTVKIKNFKLTGFSPKPTAVTYQWLRNGKVIAKATKTTYKLVKADKGKKISVRISTVLTGYATGAFTTAGVKVKK